MPKKNSYIEEQRRQREELYKLKKMRQGTEEAVAEPAPQAKVPHTPKEKIQNYWYYYKPVVLGGIACILILAILLTQCAKRIDYDMEIVYFTYTPVLKAQLDETEKFFESFAEDINGNGKVEVLMVDCSFNPNGSDMQYKNSILTKLQTVIAGNPKAMVFITDQESIEYFNQLSGDVSLFDGEPYVFGDEFYQKTKSDEYGELPRGLQISCRHLANTALEKNSESKKYYKPSLEYVKRIIEADKNNYRKEN